MKLIEIKQLDIETVDLMEGVIPPHLTMTLEQIVRNNKITNNVQTFVLSGLVGLFKNGGPTRWPRELNPYPMNVGEDVIEGIRSLTNEEAAELASWMLTELQKTTTFETNPFPTLNPQMSTVEWVRWVLRRQD